MTKALTALVLAAGLLGLAWGIYGVFAGSPSDGTGRSRSGRGGAAVAVEIAPVSKATIREVGRLSGSLSPRARFVVAPRIAGAPHWNPDGQEIGTLHLHLYREGFGDKWALPAPGDRFTDLNDPWQTLDDFMRYCNVVEPPNIRRGLFT